MGASEGEDLASTGGDGTSLVGRLWPVGAPCRHLLLLVHGLKDHSGRYAEVAAALNARGIAVAAFDLRGHGRSGGERAWVRRFEEYAADLDAELRLLDERVGRVPITLFGHSLGGAVASRYAIDHPQRFRGLVLSSPALRPPSNAPAGAAGAVRFLSAVAPHARIFRPDVPGFSRLPAVVESILGDPLVDQKPVPARTAAELLKTMSSVRRDAPGVRLPILVFHGTADRVTALEGSQEFVDRSASSDKRLLRVPDAFHDLWHEPEAPDLRRELADWISARADLSGAPG
jgi:acylglycerol lipase